MMLLILVFDDKSFDKLNIEAPLGHHNLTEIQFLYNVKVQEEGVLSSKDIDSLRLCSVNSSILLTNGIPWSETYPKLHVCALLIALFY